jgi:hypothetical protein
MIYVTYDPATRKLTGGYWQDYVPPDGLFIEVTEAIFNDWTDYEPNADFTGVVLRPPYIPPPPTFEQIAAALQLGVQQHLDGVAQAFGYDDLLAAASYADELADTVFEAEGKALRAWRSLAWRGCYSMFAEAAAGTIPVPTLDQVIAALPAAPVQADVRAAVAAQGAPA